MIEKKESKGEKIVISMLMVLPVLIAVAFLGYAVHGVLAAERYLKIYQNPLVVKATVSDHDEYDDDSDTDYRSYITYYVDGIKYDHIEYEDVDSENQLTPMGTQLEIEVDPEKPSETLKAMRSHASFSGIMLLLASFPLAFVCSRVIEGKRSKDFRYIGEDEKIQKDALLTVWGRSRIWLFLFLIVGSYFLTWRYQPIFDDDFLLVTYLSVCLEIYSLLTAVRLTMKIRHNDITVHKAVLVNKEIYEGSEDTNYYLHYEYDGNLRKEHVSYKRYKAAQIDETAFYVFINGKKKPLFFYDYSGNAATAAIWPK